MESFDRLRDMMYRELDEISEKTAFAARDFDSLQKITDIIKNLDKIEMLEGESQAAYDDEHFMRGKSRGANYLAESMGRTSRTGEWQARGEYGRDGSMTSNRHMVRSHYSRADVKDHMIDQLQSMISNADSEESRQALERCMTSLQNT